MSCDKRMLLLTTIKGLEYLSSDPTSLTQQLLAKHSRVQVYVYEKLLGYCFGDCGSTWHFLTNCVSNSR